MRQLSKAASLLSVVSVAEMFFRFIRTKCIAVFLDRAGTGFLSQLTLFFEALRVWGDLGARRAVIRQVAKHKQEDLAASQEYRLVLTSSFFLVLTVSSSIGLVVAVFSRVLSAHLFGDGRYAMYVSACALILPFASVTSLIGAILKGGMEHASFVRYSLGSYVTCILAVPPLVYFGGYWGAIAAQFLLYACPLGGFLLLNARRRFLYFAPRPSGSVLKEELSFAFVSLYSNTLNRSSMLIAGMWITRGLGLEQMGVYQVVITLATVYLSVPVQSISGYILPQIARAADTQEAVKAINDAIRYFLFLLVPVVAVLMTLPEFFITLFFSDRFLDAAPVLRVQLCRTVFVLCSAAFSTALAARGEYRSMMVLPTVSVGVYLVAAAALFPLNGLQGIACADALSAGAMFLAGSVMLRRKFSFRMLPKNLKLIVATAVWLAAAALAGAGDSWAAKWTVLLALGPVWFYAGSKDHERAYLAGKLRTAAARLWGGRV